ncbi:MAG: hypothetical protein Q8Q36_02125 [bacterium]|nr:hypothetical protein [bacterium]
MSWSTRRQLLVLLILLLVLFIVAGIFLFPYILKAPTCSDGVKNGLETGVDCGGACERVCTEEAAELDVLWARTFKVADGVYDAVAYVENPNARAGVREIVYKFSLYDGENLLVTERVGKTHVSPNGAFPIFEGGIRTGVRVPKRTFFEFAEEPAWERLSDKAASFSLGTGNIRLEDATGSPRLTAAVSNRSIYTLADVEVMAVLYDERENALGVSETFIDTLSKGESAQAVFTWLLPFPRVPTRIEVVPRVNLFSIPF